MNAGCASPSWAGPVLVVSGEPSGDRLAAGVITSLEKRAIRCFGMGGAASIAAGLAAGHTIARPAMGLSEVVAQLPRALRALTSLVRESKRRRPRAAVLVDYTEFNLRLGRRLRAVGVPVLWCVAPQVWAWRPARARSVLSAFDRLAVVLPFELPIWRELGADVHYVGHPALDTPSYPPAEREGARAALHLTPELPAIALLPGSRAHEVRRHLPAMLAAARALAAQRPLQWRLLLAGALDPLTHSWAAALAGAQQTVPIPPAEGAQGALRAFDGAVVASGTATLESALAGAPPVVVYRASPITAWVARRLLRVSHIGLANLLLDTPAYPELLQADMRPDQIARALGALLDDRPSFTALPARLRSILMAGLPTARSPLAPAPTCPERIAALLDDWLAAPCALSSMAEA